MNYYHYKYQFQTIKQDYTPVLVYLWHLGIPSKYNALDNLLITNLMGLQ